MNEKKITYPCGCTVTTVASGTLLAGTMRRYCDRHNPYQNIIPRVEIIKP